MDAENSRFQRGFLLLAACTSMALLLSGWALYARFSQTNEIRTDQARVWHAVICTIELQVKHDHLSDRKKQAAYRFYDHLLTRDVNAPPCGLATPIQKGASQ